MVMFNTRSPIFSGGNEPVRIESDALCLEVEGDIPEQLIGSYYRLSADPQFPTRLRPILVEFDGHVSAFHFRGNNEVDYVGRYVHTERFLAERKARRALFGTYRNKFHDDPSVEGVDRTTANTAFLHFDDRFFALKEDGLPYELHPETLETLGRCDFQGQITSKTFSAHPKIDPETGEMFAFGSQAKGEGSSDIAYFVFDKRGRKTVERWFQAPFASIVHDLAVTSEWVVLPVMPATVDLDRMRKGGATYVWEPEKGTHIAVFRRDGTGEVRWFETTASYAFHVVNSYQEGERLIVDVMDAPEFPMWWPSEKQLADLRSGKIQRDNFIPQLTRWTFDLAGDGRDIEREMLHPWEGEMPRIDDRVSMRPYRYAVYGVDNPEFPIAHNAAEVGVNHNSIGWWDHATRQLTSWYTGPNSSVGEPLFVPRSPDAPEGDGFVIATVQRLAERRSEVVILDTRAIESGPIARIHPPHRLKNGIHNAWIPREHHETKGSSE